MFFDTFKALCDKRGVSCKRAVTDMGLSNSLATKWKKTGATPQGDTLNKLAHYFGVSVDSLLEPDPKQRAATLAEGGASFVILDQARLVQFPVIGSISAGYDCVAVEKYTGDIELIPFAGLRGQPEEYFVLRVEGDSMYPRLIDGDRVLVRRASIVENGKIAVVIYNGEEATIKKVKYMQGTALELIPFNPEYKVKCIQGEALEHCRIIGEVIQLIRNL